MRDWNYNHSVFARIEDEKDITFAGTPCIGCYRLRVVCDVQLFANRPDGQIYAFHAMGRLTSPHGEIALMTPDGRVSLVTAAGGGGRGLLSLAVDLDLRRLLALDARRRAHDSLPVTLTVWGLANGPQGVQDFFGSHAAKISQEQWLAVLRDTQYAETVLIEVVAPKEVGDGRLEAAVSSLARAQARLRRTGEDTTAAGDCRLAIDKLKKQFAPPKLPRLSREVQRGLLRSLGSLTLDERLLLLKYALRHVTNLPHHDDERPFTPAQADLVVQVTAACIAYEMKSRIRSDY